MGILIRLSLLSALLCFGQFVCAQETTIKVITSINTDSVAMNNVELKNLYMGFSKSQNLQPVALSPGQYARTIFNTKVIGMTESRIQAFWAQMKFSGRTQPPAQFEDVNAMIDYIASHIGAVGYVPSDFALPESVRVIEVRL